MASRISPSPCNASLVAAGAPLLASFVLLLAACSRGSAGGPSAPLTANAAPLIEQAIPAQPEVAGEVGQSLTFEVQASDPDGTPLTFEVLLDGRRVAAASSYSFTPDSAGTHRVEVRISDGVHVVVQQWTITVTPDVANPPAAALSVTPDSGTAPLQVAIAASGTDADGSIVRVQVDADGDGQYESEGPGPLSLSRVFNEAGTFRVRARVTDDEGLTGLAERQVKVRPNLPPRAVLSLAPAEGPAPLEVRVQGSGTDPDGVVALYELDADGDGTYEVSQTGPIDTTLVFTDYTRSTTLSLRVTDAGGATGTAQATVQPLPDVDRAASQISQSESGRLLADGRATRRITLRLVDRQGRPLPRVDVVLTSSRNAGAGETVDRLRPESGLTDAGGTFESQLSTTSSSTLLGDARIGATAAGEPLNGSLTVQFASAVNIVQTTVSCPVRTVHVIGSPSEPRSAPVRVEPRDASGRALPGVFIELRTRDLDVWRVTPPSGRADGSGVFRAEVTSTAENSNTFLDIVADGLRTSAVCFFVFIP